MARKRSDGSISSDNESSKRRKQKTVACDNSTVWGQAVEIKSQTAQSTSATTAHSITHTVARSARNQMLTSAYTEPTPSMSTNIHMPKNSKTQEVASCEAPVARQSGVLEEIIPNAQASSAGRVSKRTKLKVRISRDVSNNGAPIFDQRQTQNARPKTPKLKSAGLSQRLAPTDGVRINSVSKTSSVKRKAGDLEEPKVASSKHQKTNDGRSNRPPQPQTPRASTGATAAAPGAISYPTQPAQAILADSSPCPIDWTHPDFNKYDQSWKDVYEMRSPWKAKSDFTGTEITEILNQKYGKGLVWETYRKRFKTLQQKVYMATGMWWTHLLTGLEEYFSNPSDAPNTSTAAVAGDTSRAVKSYSAGAHPEAAAQYHGKDLRYIQYDESILMIRGRDIETGDMFFRYAPFSVAYESSGCFADEINNGISIYLKTLNTTRVAMDLFIACFVPEQKDSLPTTIFKLEGGRFSEYPVDALMSDLFHLYILAAELRSDKVCNLVINFWRKMYMDEPKSDELAGAPPSIMSFAPADLNALFMSKSVRDNYPAARNFWLDVLGMGNTGFEKIRNHLGEYHPAFLSEWEARLSKQQVSTLSEKQRTLLLESGELPGMRNYHYMKVMSSWNPEDSGSDENSNSGADSDSDESDFDPVNDIGQRRDSGRGKYYLWRNIKRETERNLRLSGLYRQIYFVNGDFCGEYHAGCSGGACTTPVMASDLGESLHLRPSHPRRLFRRTNPELLVTRASQNLGSHVQEEGCAQ